MDLVNKDVHLNSWNAVDGIFVFLFDLAYCSKNGWL